MEQTRAAGRSESGQVTTALVMVVTVALVAVAISGVLLLSRGVDEKSKAQSAADAAALAGAGALYPEITNILSLLSRKSDLADLVGCGFGQDRASTYAAKNDASLTSYCFDFPRDRVEASVRMHDRVSDEVGPAVAEAVAATGLNLAACSWRDDDPPPSPTPTPTPTDGPGDGGPGDGGPGDGGPDPTPTPEPPPDLGTTLTCGPLTARFTISGTTGLLTLVDVTVHDLKPRLVD